MPPQFMTSHIDTSQSGGHFGLRAGIALAATWFSSHMRELGVVVFGDNGSGDVLQSGR
jgi:hypothetical protein